MSDPGTWFFSRVLHHIDRPLLRATDGTLSVPDKLAGMPVALLTTTGAVTGKDRTVPVLAFRDGEAWVVVASNWGRDDHPDWYHNLCSTPEVTVTRNGTTERCRARTLSGQRRAEYLNMLTDRYIGYKRHQERTSRQFPIVRLTPVENK
jgi:deazaflavin-dependent oxidoreductase (nitroreductase family)